ncbi:HIT finger domain-containing protein [Clathrospora elynae]|uniref:Box C/D snoRNA protein 1 n=1 Tax=Clathrospora elynae TaxID=706981 RepID=A0A6A5SXP8_9PLEO|nr:HIT finger domain-containing protein [Clathrospora elynae]
MSDAALLSDLCSICNATKSKYRCPGCAARTCSLPCYKRHQQWAQCSGQRDPTKFVKKSQLVTPAGIDHDFNFLSGIERNLEKAERVAGATGAGAAPDPKPKNQQAGINYSRLEAAGVSVIRAPQGLSRQKENKSHSSSTKKAKRNILWTVEWFDETKKRVLTETSSTAQIKDAQPFVQRTPVDRYKRRKLNAEAYAKMQSYNQDVTSTPEHQVQPLQRLEIDTQLNVDNAQSEPVPSGRGTAPQEQEEQATKGPADIEDAHPPEPRIDGLNPEPVGDEQSLYFLLRPRTSSSRQVLIPLDGSQTLGESLYGRTVLEFPTIYAFPSSMAQLPDEFMLEEEYIKQEGEEQREFDELMRELDPEILRRLKEDGPPSDGVREEEVDSKRILDVLKQDLGGGF